MPRIGDSHFPPSPPAIGPPEGLNGHPFSPGSTIRSHNPSVDPFPHPNARGGGNPAQSFIDWLQNFLSSWRR